MKRKPPSVTERTRQAQKLTRKLKILRTEESDRLKTFPTDQFVDEDGNQLFSKKE